MIRFDNQVIVADPAPLYRELLQKGRIHRYDPMGVWLVVRYKDVQAALLDRRLLSGGKRSTKGIDHFREDVRRIHVPLAGSLGETLNRMMLNLNPPEHTRLRRHLNSPFSRLAVERYRGHVEREARRLVEHFPRTPFDLVAKFAYPLPAGIICEILAMPEENRAELIRLSDDVAYFFAAMPPTLEQLVRASESGQKMAEYFRHLHAERKDSNGDDLISMLARFVHTGQEDRITADDVAAQCIMLLMAGQETSRNFIAMTCRTMLRSPDQLRCLADDPGLIPAAVEECFRFETPIQLVAREVGEPLTIGDVHLKQGEVVFLMLGAANRDPDVFTDADQFDIHRPNAHQHLAFGAGLHLCIGAELARLEAAVTLEVLVPHLLNMRLAGDSEWTSSLALRGLKNLPVEWSPSQRKPALVGAPATDD